MTTKESIPNAMLMHSLFERQHRREGRYRLSLVSVNKKITSCLSINRQKSKKWVRKSSEWTYSTDSFSGMSIEYTIFVVLIDGLICWIDLEANTALYCFDSRSWLVYKHCRIGFERDSFALSRNDIERIPHDNSTLDTQQPKDPAPINKQDCFCIWSIYVPMRIARINVYI